MSRLNNTKILRSCPSNPFQYDPSDPRFGWREEDDKPHINANNGPGINLIFDIKAGRGLTELMVNIPKDDIHLILEEIAKAIPDATTLFSKYSSLAIELHKDHKEKMKSCGGYSDD